MSDEEIKLPHGPYTALDGMLALFTLFCIGLGGFLIYSIL